MDHRQSGWVRRFARAAVCSVALVALPSLGLAQQPVTFESTVADLASKDPKVRLRAVDLLKAAAYPEGAIPLAPLLTDPVDDIQLSAIAAELNTFLAEKVTPRKRVGFLVEVRGNISAEPIFSAGSSVLTPRRVPLEVAVALAAAAVDKSPRVSYEAMYAFGALAGEVAAADRPQLLQRTSATFAGLLAIPDPNLKIATLRVIGRVFGRRPGDGPIDEKLGDAVIATVNAFEPSVREMAMWTLGELRYERSVQGLSDLVTFYRKGPLAERAFDAVARIGNQANMGQFVEKLNGNNLTLKMIAIEGIARSGDRERFASIDTLLKKEKHEAVLLAGHFANVLLADGPVTAIVDALSRNDLHAQASQYVYELVPGRVAAFAPLVRSAKGVRLDIVEALGASGDAAALAVVQPLTTDKEPAVALAAQRAVARLQR